MKKKYLPVVVVGIIMVLSVIIYFVRSARIKDLPDILKDDRLSVLIDSGEHGFTKDSLKVYGFQYEIIKSFSNSIGVELVVINEENTRDGIAELTNGECDVLVSLRPVVNDSTLPIRYLTPIISTRLMLAQRKDSTDKCMIAKQYELDQDTITLMPNSPYTMRLKALSEEVAADITIQEADQGSLDNMIRMVSENKCRYTVCPEYLSGNLMKRYPNVDIHLPLSYKQDLSWSVNQQSVALYEKLNAFLQEFVLTPEYQRLCQRYFIDK
ncbi:MAG: transporter substrate-binding domain-containing protein [Paludibacter sp.]|nr:transporter substrate-binding domain-containing protein [Paludibacter sp.]